MVDIQRSRLFKISKDQKERFYKIKGMHTLKERAENRAKTLSNVFKNRNKMFRFRIVPSTNKFGIYIWTNDDKYMEKFKVMEQAYQTRRELLRQEDELLNELSIVTKKKWKTFEEWFAIPSSKTKDLNKMTSKDLYEYGKKLKVPKMSKSKKTVMVSKIKKHMESKGIGTLKDQEKKDKKLSEHQVLVKEKIRIERELTKIRSQL